MRFNEPCHHVYVYSMIRDVTNKQPPATPEGLR